MSELLNKKIKSLATFLDISENEIEFAGDINHPRAYDFFNTPNGTFTIMTEEEADEEHYEYIENFIDELGITAFTDDFQEEIHRKYIYKTPFENFCIDDYDGYASDIEHETYQTKYANRLIDECVESGIITEEDIDENGEYTGNLDLIAELRDYIVEDIRKDYDGDFIEWFSDNFGKDQLDKFIKEVNCELDIQGISDACIEADGYGHSLSQWDGETNEEGEFYIFKQSNYDERSDSFKENLKK